MKQEKKEFITVIGNRNAGKSTIIVSLTGCRNRSFRGMVEDRLTMESIYVIACSPQEKALEKEGYVDLDAFRIILNQVIQEENCRGLVMAIQPIRPTRRPSLEAIIQEVQSRNVFEPYLFVLEPGRNDPPEAQGILAEVNQRLRNTGIGLVAQGLDGRRFAFLNARQINQVS